MAEPNTTGAYALFIMLGALGASLEQGPAMGAVFGSFFFLATPSPAHSVKQKFFLLLFSIGLGYSVGYGIKRMGGFEGFAMFCALAAAALGSGMFASWHNYQNGGPVPAWIMLLLDRLPFLKKRGDANG